MLPGVFDTTIFSPRRSQMPSSIYIPAMHPKTEIAPTRASVEKTLKAGWIGQTKIHGHRAQIHLSEKNAIVYNRQGRPHAKALSPEIVTELRRLLPPGEGYTVVDAEWLKPENKVFLFDLLKRDGQLLNRMTYRERHALLPRAYISKHVQTLPLLTTLERCMEVLADPDPLVEGLVFKADRKGFEDTSIVRCRKR